MAAWVVGCKRHGCWRGRPNGLFLLCTHTNLGARRSYEGLGYAQVGEVPDYLTPGLREVIYFKAAPSV